MGPALQEAILKLLATAPDGLSSDALIQHFGLEPSRIYNAIRSLREREAIAPTIRHGWPGNRWQATAAKATASPPAAAQPFVRVDEVTARIKALRAGLGKLANLVDDDAGLDEATRGIGDQTDGTLLDMVRLEVMSGLNKVSALSAALMPLYEVAGVPVGDGTELFLVVNQAVRRVRAAAEAGVTWEATVDGPVARLPAHPRMNEALLKVGELQGDLNKAHIEMNRLHEATKAHGELAARYHELACRLYGVDASETSTHPVHEHLLERIDALSSAPKPPPAPTDTRVLALLRERARDLRFGDSYNGLVAELLLAMVDDLNGVAS